MDYTTCSDVENFLKNYGIQAGASGVPTAQEITDICTFVSSELDAIFKGAGISLPINTNLQYIRQKATLGAAYNVLIRMDMEPDKTMMLENEWNRFLKYIQRSPATFMASDSGASYASYDEEAYNFPNKIEIGETRQW